MPMIKTSLDRSVVPLADLHEADYNPRNITPKARAGLDASLTRWGLVQDIVVNRRTVALGFDADELTIVGGHRRVDALKAHGVSEVPVTFVDLTPAEEIALNVSLNNPLIAGEYDYSALALIVEALKTEGADLEAIRLAEILRPAKQVEFEVAPSYTYSVIVDFKNEIEQSSFLKECEKVGHRCRLLIS